MILNDENLDYPDCMVPRANNSIKTPEWLQKMLDKAERERAPKGEADDATA